MPSQVPRKAFGVLERAGRVVVRKLSAAHGPQSITGFGLQRAWLCPRNEGCTLHTRLALRQLPRALSDGTALTAGDQCSIHVKSAYGPGARLLLSHYLRVDNHATRLTKRGGSRRAVRRFGSGVGWAGNSGCGICDGCRAPDDVTQDAGDCGSQWTNVLCRLGGGNGA